MTDKEEFAALKQDIKKIKEDLDFCVERILDMKLDIGDRRRETEHAGERIARLSEHLSAVLCEHRDRITALESRHFENVNDFRDLHQIIGPPNNKTPEALDKSYFARLFSPKRKPGRK